MFDLRVDNARLYPMDGTAKPSAARSFAISNGSIVALDAEGPARETYDARGAVVLPGFVDCHTHAVYAGDRAHEHRLKLAGASYADIARAGGGILSTVRAVRAASESELVDAARPRLAALGAEGVTTLEIKSGYGLDVETELKMLRVIRALAQQTPHAARADAPGGARRAARIESPRLHGPRAATSSCRACVKSASPIASMHSSRRLPSTWRMRGACSRARA